MGENIRKLEYGVVNVVEPGNKYLTHCSMRGLVR